LIFDINAIPHLVEGEGLAFLINLVKIFKFNQYLLNIKILTKFLEKTLNLTF